jgi:hypothetical protein
MSYTEFHTGKLYPVRIEKDLETTCHTIAKRHNIELEEDWREDFMDKFNEYAFKRKSVNEEYFIHGDKLYRIIDHEESDSEEYFMKLGRNNDGSISFVGQFYNGGTCFSEMLEEALDDLKPTYEERTSEVIREIVDSNNLTKPTTVPQAAKMILDHKGLEFVRELFTGLIEESKHDIFKKAAYESTLKTILSGEE